jgi:hypothetical protein
MSVIQTQQVPFITPQGGVTAGKITIRVKMQLAYPRTIKLKSKKLHPVIKDFFSPDRQPQATPNALFPRR